MPNFLFFTEMDFWTILILITADYEACFLKNKQSFKTQCGFTLNEISYEHKKII